MTAHATLRQRRRASHAVFAVAFMFVLSGCEGSGLDAGSFDSALIAVGLADEQPPPALTVAVDIDATPGSSGAVRANIVETLTEVLDAIAGRPGSRVRLWMLNPVSATHLVREIEAPARESGGAVSDDARQEFVARELAESLASLDPLVEAAGAARRSPIAESIARISLADSFGHARHLVVIPDGRERAALNLECGAPLPAERFASALRARGLLAPGSLPLRVHLAHLRLAPLRDRRCTATYERESAVRAAWTTALEAAGADVSITTGPPEIEAEPPTPAP